MQIVATLHEMSKFIFWKNKKKKIYYKMSSAEIFLPRVLLIKLVPFCNLWDINQGEVDIIYFSESGQ